MNSPIAKRDALKQKLQAVLQAVDANYRVEDRLRKETFAGDRDARIQLMGEDYTYAEVLGPINVTTAEASRTAKATTHKKRHQFDVIVWLKFDDNEEYANSSQSKWDTLVWDDTNGILNAMENSSQLTDANTDEAFTLSMPTQVLVSEVPMDQQFNEQAHYLNFKIELIDP